VVTVRLVVPVVPEYEGLLCVAEELGLEYTGRSWGAAYWFEVDFSVLVLLLLPDRVVVVYGRRTVVPLPAVFFTVPVLWRVPVEVEGVLVLRPLTVLVATRLVPEVVELIRRPFTVEATPLPEEAIRLASMERRGP